MIKIRRNLYSASGIYEVMFDSEDIRLNIGTYNKKQLDDFCLGLIDSLIFDGLFQGNANSIYRKHLGSGNIEEIAEKIKKLETDLEIAIEALEFASIEKASRREVSFHARQALEKIKEKEDE